MTEEEADNIRKDLYDQLHMIVTYGNGYDYNTVYNFPRWLRVTTLSRIAKEYKEKYGEEDTEQKLNKLKSDLASNQIQVPSYITTMKKKP